MEFARYAEVPDSDARSDIGAEARAGAMPIRLPTR